MEASFRGGSQIGWVNLSWPFAKLTVSDAAITLSGFGSYTFSPSEVSSIEPYGWIPVIASGLQINHNRSDYPRKVIFWCVRGRARVLAAMEDAGFKALGQALDRPTGIPVRWSVLALGVIVWNCLFLLDFHRTHAPAKLGAFSWLAITLLLAATTAIRLSPAVQRLVLNDGRNVGEIRSALSLLQLISAIGTVALGISLWIPENGG